MNRGSIRKIVKAVVRCLMFTILCTQTQFYAFDGPTHKDVTEKSLKIFLKMGEDYNEFYSEKAVTEIVKYCTKPDEDENDGLYKNHFFNIANERNFMGERMSALVKFTSHYNAAIVNYKTGREMECWEELGRSIHFLEDLITPVHSGYDCPLDAVNKLPMHVNFEKKCVQIQSKCLATIQPEELVYFADNSLEEIGKMCSRIANDNFFSLEKKLVPEKTIAHYAVKDAQRVVTGLLYRFYEEVHELNIN